MREIGLLTQENKMFDNLGEKIQQAHEYGLDSLL